MKTNKSLEKAAVEAYRAGAKSRRANTQVNNKLSKMPGPVDPNITRDGGVITVRKPANAKSASSLGGATKALGTSAFSIPEFKRYAKRSPR